MSEIWKRWEGQVIDHKYQLRQFLGSTDHSAVFLAEYRDPELRKAAVKFLAADLPQAEQVLADWKQAQQLSHPNLLPIHSVGRCRIEDMELLYAAMEYADENLSEILPHRPLAPDEAREILTVLADVLVYLHGKSLTHGHIKPSNIMAIGDQLRLTSDTIQPLAEAREMRRKRDVYDAPEIPASAYTRAADVWSLGVTLVEALTQQPAFLPFNENVEPVIPSSVREPFLEIATHALRRDPAFRWTAVDVAVRLNPEAAESVEAALAAAATSGPVSTATANTAAANTATPKNAAGPSSVAGVAVAAPPPAPPAQTPWTPPSTANAPVSPLSVPLSKEPAVPLGKQSIPKSPSARPPMPPPPVPRPESPASRQAVVLPNYVLPLFAAVLILIAVIALPKILHRGTESSANNAPVSRTSESNPADNSSKSTAASAPKQPAKSAPTPPSNSDSSAYAPPSRSTPASPTSSPAILHSTGSAPVTSPRKASGSPDRGEVLDQILPRPSSAALATIAGTLRVVVKVHVDGAGNVSQATLENPGPSKYFSQKSLEAARGWVFLSPAVDGHSQPSEWLIRFEFTPSGVNAYPSQVKP